MRRMTLYSVPCNHMPTILENNGRRRKSYWDQHCTWSNPQIGNVSSTCPMSRDRLRVTKIFERPRKSLQQRIQVYRASRSPCFAHCEQDCSPSFTMLVTLCMMLFFFVFSCFVLFCLLSFIIFFFALFAFILVWFFSVGEGRVFFVCLWWIVIKASIALASIVSIDISMSVILLFLIMSKFYQSKRFCWTLLEWFQRMPLIF